MRSGGNWMWGRGPAQCKKNLKKREVVKKEDERVVKRRCKGEDVKKEDKRMGKEGDWKKKM
jgi:hypothetical protein